MYSKPNEINKKKYNLTETTLIGFPMINVSVCLTNDIREISMNQNMWKLVKTISYQWKRVTNIRKIIIAKSWLLFATVSYRSQNDKLNMMYIFRKSLRRNASFVECESGTKNIKHCQKSRTKYFCFGFWSTIYMNIRYDVYMNVINEICPYEQTETTKYTYKIVSSSFFFVSMSQSLDNVSW